MDAGVDSLAATELVSQLRASLSISLSPTLIFEHPTARGIAEHISQHDRLITDEQQHASSSLEHVLREDSMKSYLSKRGLAAHVEHFNQEGFETLDELQGLDVMQLHDCLSDLGLSDAEQTLFIIDPALRAPLLIIDPALRAP